MSNNKMREALEAVYECAKDGVLTIRESAFEKVVAALAEPPTQAEICESMLKSFAECDTSIIRWSVTYPPGGTIAKVEIPRAVYEMLLAAFRKVCRVKLALRKDEGGANG